MHRLTPLGVDDFTPAIAKKHDLRLKKMAALAEKFGYTKVRTPTIEYEESLEPGLGHHLKRNAIKFFDATGRTLILRPDHTTPIARLVASQMQNDPLPLHLYYQNSIFQRSPETDHGDIEIFQHGYELIGNSSPVSDAEIIILLAKTLSTIGIKNCHIDIGHVDFAKGLSKKNRRALLDGDYIAFGALPEQGDVTCVSEHPELQQLDSELKKNDLNTTISFNKGLIKHIDYYTGIIFEAYIPNTGQAIASGGRYNHLLKSFGYDHGAVGVAINMNLVREILE